MAIKTVFASGKGGVGKSSVTAGLASALAERGKKVLTVDSDIGLRSLDLILGVNEKMIFNWGDVILGYCESEDATITTGSVDLLGAPLEFDEEFTKENLKKVLEKIEDKYDFILIDCPAGIGEGFRLASSVADNAIIIVTPDEVSVRSGEIAANALYSQGMEDVKVIINRFKEKSTIKGRLLNIDDVIDSAKLQLQGIVPEDPDITYSAIKGKPVEKGSPSYSAFKRIASRMCGENTPLFKKV
ncbi:MAG: AAA family ATPase [Clostridia bacterium]|nr:AAA family ATPase [Clostridia bacterium]